MTNPDDKIEAEAREIADGQDAIMQAMIQQEWPPGSSFGSRLFVLTGLRAAARAGIRAGMAMGEAERAGLVDDLREARRAIGDHHAPFDCYATGPMTGNDYRDLIECPACSFIARYDARIAELEKEGRK